jgi:NAD(P)-dependent dehydrogenase (short-subunit alcohol dehydrogenase family)
MSAVPFVFISPATRGLSLALTRHFLARTSLPIYATYRGDDPAAVHAHILSPFAPSATGAGAHVDADRLKLLPLDLTCEDSIAAAADKLQTLLPHGAYMHTGWFTGGVLHPERSPADLCIKRIQETFQINAVSHLLLMKHFSCFLPSRTTLLPPGAPPAKWVHVTARVGSISDNRLGGWFSYRASKAALNQSIRTFDLWLRQRKMPAIAVGVHPGTVKTNLSREFWGGVAEGKLFEPEYAAERLASVVDALGENARGRVWDWKGEEIPS